MATPNPAPEKPDDDLLPSDPPRVVIRAIAWLTILIFFTGLVASCVIRIPETVRCPFMLVSREGTDPIKTPLDGLVERVLVNEGQSVAAGQTLFVIRSDQVRAWQTELATLREDLGALKQQAIKSLEAHQTQLRLNDGERVQLEQEVGFRRKFAQTSRDFTSRLHRLKGEGIVSEVELLSRELDLAGAEKDLAVAEKSLQQVELGRARLIAERARSQRQEEAEHEKLTVRIAALEKQLEKCKEDQRCVVAPYDGILSALSVHSAGAVVRNGDVLGQLARTVDAPRARLETPEEGLSKLAPGQRVQLFFEAFPYQRHGSVPSTLIWVAPASRVADELRFSATADLDNDAIRSGRQTHALRVGMRGQARVLVGRRRLIEYAFEPLRELRENLQP
jgi:HlyD family secretion protein